jgi:hypothetical protein
MSNNPDVPPYSFSIFPSEKVSPNDDEVPSEGFLFNKEDYLTGNNNKEP